MDFQLERKIKANFWIIKSRWYYILGLSFIGVMLKILGRYDFPYWLNFSLASFALLVNFLFFYFAKKIEQSKPKISLAILSYSQIIFELFIFTSIFYFGGSIESSAAIFYILPIFSSSLVLNPKGSLVVAFLSGALISSVVALEHLGVLPHFYRFGEPTIHYENSTIAFSTVLTHAVFYIIIGVYSSFIAKIFSKREIMLRKNAEALNKETRLRKKEIKKTKEIKDKSIAIIANLSDPIIVLDEKHRFSLFNPAAEEVFGVGIPDLGKKIECTGNICRYQYDLNSYKKLIKKDFTVRRIQEERIHDLSVEEMTINYNGEERVYKVITSKVTGDHGEYYGVMKIFYDLTRENRIDRMKSEFISVAAHQLRTPLSAIKWSIDIVLKEAGKKIGKDNVDLLMKSYKSNERMIALVNDLLNVSRIEEGRFGYVMKKYNFKEIVDSIMGEVGAIAKERRIKIKINSPKVLPNVEVDKDKILMVLQNLLDNAIKYSKKNGIVKVNVKKVKNNIQVTIKDDGIGIPKKEQEKLFKKFFRAENVIKMETEGTGLGLFIARNIIHKHGGEISFQSEEGKGTEFTFTIPIKNGSIKNN